MSNLTSAGGSATGLLGAQSAPKDIGYDAKIIMVPVGTTIATRALALIEATWLNAINSTVGSRYIVLPIFKELESTPEDDVTAEFSLGGKSFVREGKDTVNYQVEVTPIVMQQMRTLNGISWSYYVVSSSGVIRSTSPDDIQFNPFTIDYFRVGKEIKPTGTTPALVPITITSASASEWSSFPSFAEPLRVGTPATWNPRDLKDPKAEIGTVTIAATITGFTIKLEGYDGVAFTGAAKEDVVIEDTTTGALTAVTTLTETAVLGTYTALATIAAGTYYIGMAPVGTVDSTDGHAGLRSELIKTENIVA